MPTSWLGTSDELWVIINTRYDLTKSCCSILKLFKPKLFFMAWLLTLDMSNEVKLHNLFLKI